MYGYEEICSAIINGAKKNKFQDPSLFLLLFLNVRFAIRFLVLFCNFQARIDENDIRERRSNQVLMAKNREVKSLDDLIDLAQGAQVSCLGYSG